MVIDVHTHVFHPKIAHKVLAQLEGHYGIQPVGTGLADDLLNRMEKAGINKSVVLTAATAPAQVVPANNCAIELLKTPEFIPFGTIHPGFKDMEAELERLERHGIKGLKFHPDFQGFRMDDPALFDVMDMIGDRFICLFHIGDTLPPEKNPSCPRKLSSLRKNFSKPVIIAAHMGGYRHWDLAVKELANSDIYVDTSSTNDFLNDDQIRNLFKSYRKDRILFGSDYPLFDAGDELNSFRKRLGFTPKDIDEMMGNARRLLLD